MSIEGALVESRTLRRSMMERAEVLDRVKVLSMLPDDLHVTTAMVAAYFEVGIEAVKSLIKDHRRELSANGYAVLAGTELRSFKDLCGLDPRTKTLAVFSRRAVLNVAMLLRDSEVARQVRSYLLDVEQAARPGPVDNSAHSRPTDPPPTPGSLEEHMTRIAEEAVTRILGKAVVPMLNALIETAGEHGRELAALRTHTHRNERKLDRHEAMVQRHEDVLRRFCLGGVMAAIDSMNWRDFEEYVAELCRRDGCTDVHVIGGRDRGVDVVGVTPSGGRLIVQCKRHAPFRSVSSGDMQRFLGAAMVQHGADVALFVASSPFTAEAQALADEYGVVAVDRTLLQSWAAGVRLPALE